MIKPELYKRTVDILVEAYFNDTLEHENCYACAVGNIIAANCNYEFERTDAEEQALKWKGFNGYGSPESIIDTATYFVCTGDKIISDDIDNQIKSTGYTVHQLWIIEKGFERAFPGKSRDEWMFNGLMAVIDVLDEIHENTDTETTAATKQRFVKA